MLPFRGGQTTPTPTFAARMQSGLQCRRAKKASDALLDCTRGAWQELSGTIAGLPTGQAGSACWARSRDALASIVRHDLLKNCRRSTMLRIRIRGVPGPLVTVDERVLHSHFPSNHPGLGGGSLAGILWPCLFNAGAGILAGI